jgi:hypothetical protein
LRAAKVLFHAASSCSFVVAAGTSAKLVAKMPRGSGAEMGTNDSLSDRAPILPKVCTISGVC